MKKIYPGPDYLDRLARLDMPLYQFAREAGVSEATMFALQNPLHHPHRIGGLHRRTSWKIAAAYAKRAGLSEEEAWKQLFVEKDVTIRRRGGQQTDENDIDE
jgi:hypothetical protein